MLFITTIVLFGCNNRSTKKTNSSETIQTDSVAYYTQMIEEDSVNISYLTARANLYLQRGNLDPALRDIQKALSINSRNAELFTLLSDVYLVLGQTENCIASLKKAIAIEPDNEVPFLKLAEVYLLLGDSKTAVNYVDEAISRNRKNAESYYLKGMVLMDNRDTSNAITNFKISANIDSSNYMTYMQLGAIYNSRNDTNSKIYFEKALKIVPNDERALYYLAMYYQEQKDFDRALELYELITANYPNNKRAYYNSGYIYLVEFEDFENAIIMFESAVNISEGYVEAVYNWGRTLEAMGNYDQARIKYREALEILPNYPLAVQSLNRLDDIQIRNKR